MRLLACSMMYMDLAYRIDCPTKTGSAGQICKSLAYSDWIAGALCCRYFAGRLARLTFKACFLNGLKSFKGRRRIFEDALWDCVSLLVLPPPRGCHGLACCQNGSPPPRRAILANTLFSRGFPSVPGYSRIIPLFPGISDKQHPSKSLQTLLTRGGFESPSNPL